MRSFGFETLLNFTRLQCARDSRSRIDSETTYFGRPASAILVGRYRWLGFVADAIDFGYRVHQPQLCGHGTDAEPAPVLVVNKERPRARRVMTAVGRTRRQEQMTTLAKIGQEKQRISERLARLNVERTRLGEQLNELETAERVLSRGNSG